jgi:hypothetical protein
MQINLLAKLQVHGWPNGVGWLSLDPQLVHTSGPIVQTELLLDLAPASGDKLDD